MIDGAKTTDSAEVLPMGDGVLIIDEVKVLNACKNNVYTKLCFCLLQVGVRLIWSSKSQKFIGHSMNHEELTTLCDVYMTIDHDFRQKPATNVFVANVFSSKTFSS